MAVLGTFGSFGIARLAIYASSAALSVTGNNIANINTTGYCRQYLSTSPMYTGGADQLSSGGSLNFGAGVSSDAIYQYRDIYMDIRYRDEATNVGYESTKLSGLTDLAYVLDEVASGEADFGIIEAQFSEIVEMLQNLSDYTGSEEYDTLVRSACETLVQLFNSYANQLDTVEENTLESFNANISATNLLLTNIRDMNEQIRNAEIYGDAALALRDQRNLLVDELSTMMGIDVIYSDEDIGMGLTVENMTIKLAGTNIELVNGMFCTQLDLEETVTMINPEIYSDGTSYFDTSKITNYMYVDEDGNYTNDADLAAPWLNPYYPEFSESAWLSSTGFPVSDVRLAGPALNEYYHSYTEPGGWSATTANYPVTVSPSELFGDNIAPVNEDGGWMGGQYAVGEIDPDTGTWRLNTDGSVYVAYTTNNKDYAMTTDPVIDATDPDNPLVVTASVTYGTIQMNNNVQDGEENDNAYLITLLAMTDAKGNYMQDNSNRDITADILLSDTVLSGSLQAFRELLTGEGEYSSKLEVAMNSSASTIRGIPYYQKTLDSLAQMFAETFNTLNNLNPDDIFGVNDAGEFYDKSQLLYDSDGLVQLDSAGNPVYEVLRVQIQLVDGTTETVTVTTDNMNDINYATGNTIYEDFIYDNGVRHPNFLTDSDGQYLQEVEIDGELYYLPIQSVDENGDLELDSNGNPVFISAGNLTAENYDVLLNGYPTGVAPDVYDTNGDVVTGVTGTGVAITQEVYDPAAMYNYDEASDTFLDKNGNPIQVDVGGTMTNLSYDMVMGNYSYWEALQDDGVLTDEYQNLLKAGNLFSNSSNTNDASGITASNISISRDWSIGEVRIVLAKGEDPGTTDNSNVLKFIAAMDIDKQYDARDISPDAWTGKNEFFKGSFQEMLTNITSTLAQETQTTTVLLNNYQVSALSLNNQRLSVSGVDLNEEATNMMQYQKSYVAAAKLMTTLDEVLQVLLNM